MGNKDPDRSIGFGFSGRRGLIDVDFGEDAGLLDPALIESREERFFEIGIEGAARSRGFKPVGAELVVLTTGGRRWAGAAGGGAGRREGRGDGCGEGSFEEIATGNTHKKRVNYLERLRRINFTMRAFVGAGDQFLGRSRRGAGIAK